MSWFDDIHIRLGIGPDDGPLVDFVEVTSSTASITWSYGRERETDDFQPASGTLVLYDRNRDFDPNNPASPYAGKLTPGRQIVVRYVTDLIFNGYIKSWLVEYGDGDTQAMVTVSFTDSLGLLAFAELDEISPAFSGDTSGERLNRVFIRDEVTFPAGTDVDDGISVLGDTTFGENALAYAQRVAKAEAGYLFCDRQGTVTFRDRHTLLNAPEEFVFVDANSATDGIRYRRIAQSSSDDLLYNRATGSSATTSLEQSVQATESRTEFGTRTLAVGELLILSDDEVLSMLQYLVQRYKEPEARFTEIDILTSNLLAVSLDEGESGVFDAATLVEVSPGVFDDAPLDVEAAPGLFASEITAAATMDLGTIVSVMRTPLGVGSEISRKCIVDRITHTLRSKPQEWVTTFGLTNADTRPFLVLDDPVLGELDAYRVAF